MIQLSRTDTRVSYSADELKGLRDCFSAEHHVLWPKLIEPALLQEWTNKLAKASFRPRAYGSFGQDEWPDEVKISASLNFLCNRRRLFEVVERITGCGPIGCFVGKIYRMVPNRNHFDSWHDDLVDDRRVALSINLSTQPYLGGDLEIRRNSEEVLARIRNQSFGDAIIFRVAEGFEHRRTAVRGTVAKTAFAGWFKSKPDFLELLGKPSTLLHKSNTSSSA